MIQEGYLNTMRTLGLRRSGKECKKLVHCETLKESWGCQNGMMKPALGCDLDFFRVCSDAKCVCDVANGYARAPDGSCVKGSDCQQYFTGKIK